MGFINKKKLMKNLIIIVVILILLVIIVAAVWDDIIKKGSTKKHNTSPSTYKQNTTITSSGLDVNEEAILDDALRDAGYTDSQIEQLRIELQNQGYTGVALEEKLAQEKLKKLKIEGDFSNMSAAELLWLVDEEIYSKYLENAEQLEYLMNAELVTQMPHLDYLDGTDKLNGTIYFQRQTEDNKKIDLTYIEEQKFEELIQKSDANVVKYFTMTQDNKIKVAYYQEESGSISTNDSTVNVSDYDSRFTNDAMSYKNAAYQTKIISYSTMIPERYSLPFDYLWALLVLSKDYDFVKGLADLSYNSEIIITVYDNVTENKTVTKYEYTRQQIDYSQINLKEEEKVESSELYSIVTPVPDEQTENSVRQMYPSTSKTYTNKTAMTNQPLEVEKEHSIENYYVTKEIYTYVNVPEVKLTYADVWIVEYTTEYNYYEDGEKISGRAPDTTQTFEVGQDTENEISGTRLTNQTLEPTRLTEYKPVVRPEATTIGKYLINVLIKETYETYETYYGDTWSELKESKQTGTEDIYMYSAKYINNAEKTNTIEKTDPDEENFCSLLIESPNKLNILNYKTWLYQMIEANEETSDMIDLTKYLIEKSENPDNAELSFDFSIYAPSSFSAFVYGDILTEYMNAWENNAVRLYINGESSYNDYVKKYITQDKKYYICYTDLNDTRNYGFGVCHWTGSKWNQVDRYSSIGVNIKDSTYNTVGSSQLEVEKVNQVRDMVINDDKQAIINQLESSGISLTNNQIDALVAVKYQYGNIGNFIQAYTNNPDTIKENFTVNGCKPFLTGYKGGVDRAKANWKVYNEAIYTDRAGNEIVTFGGDFLNVAAETWKKVCEMDPDYGGASIPITGETIDCSSYVSWVLYNYGYTEFGGWQTTSQLFYNTDWNVKYGWQEIKVASKENPINMLKPGDIFVRYEGTGKGQTHHVLIVAEISDGKLMAFDCGSKTSWSGNSTASPKNKSYFLTESGAGKIIRVTDNNGG